MKKFKRRENKFLIAVFLVFCFFFILEDSLSYYSLESDVLFYDAGFIGLFFFLPVEYWLFKQKLHLLIIPFSPPSRLLPISSNTKVAVAKIFTAAALCFVTFFVAGTLGEFINLVGPKNDSRHVQAVVKAKKKSEYEFGTHCEITLRWNAKQYTMKVLKEKWESIQVNDDILMTIREGAFGYMLVQIEGPVKAKQNHEFQPDY
jgi:hypothetical protein